MTITQETSAPLFVVVGSTGIQGTSVINALKEDEKLYRVRALTRDPSKDIAKERAAWGCEVVAADTGDLDSMTNAFVDADYGFAMTMGYYGPDEPNPLEKEYAEGKNQVDAAKASGIKVLVWAGLPSITKLSSGKYKSAYFDAKAKVTEYARTIESATFRVIDVQPGSYVSNYYGLFGPQPAGDGSFVTRSFPNFEPIIDMERDYGHFVLGAIRSGKLDTVLAASEYVSRDTKAASFAKMSGGKTIKTIEFSHQIEDLVSALKTVRGEAHAQDVRNTILALSEYGFWEGTDLGPSNAILSRPARKFEDAVLAYHDRFQKVFA